VTSIDDAGKVSLDPRQVPTTGDSGPPQVVAIPEPSAGTEFELPQDLAAEIRAIPGRFPAGARSPVMPALDLVQERYGHLKPELMAAVARLLDLDPGYVEGVATFYTLFHLQPTGKHHFYVCNNLSCQLRGAEQILAHVKERIGVIDYADVSADGLFSVEPVECLGACEMAPMMRFEHAYHYDLTTEYIDRLIDERRNRAAPAAAKMATPASARTRRRA
jgi:NADH-quinone oxidoreductase subunit E